MGATILILEDDPVLQGLLREVLEDEGYHIVAADSLAALLELAPAHPQLLITDLLINFELVGLQAIKQLRQRTYSQLPVLICSAAQKHFEQLEPEIAQLGARLLAKPFTIDELVSAVAQALKPACEPKGIAPFIPAFV